MGENPPLRDLPTRRPTDVVSYAGTRSSLLVTLADQLMTWIERARSRRALGCLDDRMLGDIGFDRGAIQAEIQKPFWRR